MKFLVPNCTKLQLPPEPLTRGLPPPDPCSLCPQLNLLNPRRKKFLGTPLLLVIKCQTMLSLTTNKTGCIYVVSYLYIADTHLYLINRVCINYIQLRNNINTPNFICF